MSKRFISTLLLLLSVGLGWQAFAQNAVSGKVTDASGEPLVGVNVLVKGTTTGIMTDLDGNWTIESVRSSDVLVFSSIGFASQEINVGNKSVINVVLSEDSTFLDEVVVLGYGTARRKHITGSISQINSDLVTAQSASSTSRALEGAVPGLKVASADGQPGVDMGIRVRGVSSANGASAYALVVIDGVPAQGSNPLSNLNSQDIETITVLKDAASTAMYGSRGANGVVLITTKRGKTGKTNINFDARWGVNTAGSYDVGTINDAATYYEFAWQSIYNSYRYGVDGKGAPGTVNGTLTTNVNNPNHTHEEAAQFASAHLFDYINSETNFQRNTLGNWMAYRVPGAIYTPTGSGSNASSTMSGAYLVNPDGKLNPNAEYLYSDGDMYSDHLLRNAFRQEYNVSASGGTDKMDYFASVGYLEDPSYIINSEFQRYSGRANLNAQLFKWLKIGANVGYTRTNTESMPTKWGRNPGSNAGNVFRIINGQGPIISLWAFDENGNYIYEDGEKKEVGSAESSYSPLGPTSSNVLGQSVLNNFNGSENLVTLDQWTSRAYADFRFLNDFVFTVNLSYDQYNSRTQKYFSSETSLGAGLGAIDIINLRTTVLNTQQLLNYNKDIKKHHFDAMAGHEYNDYSTDQLRWTSSHELIPGFISPGNFTSRYMTNSVNSALGNDSWSKGMVRMESYFGRANYIYDDKYYVSASIRADGSSKFYRNKWGTFWSVGLGWRFSSEKFMEGTRNWLDNAKLRASYGVIGNQNGIGNYTNHTWSYGVATWNSSTSGQGNPKTFRISAGGLVNEELTWENQHSFDVGLDFSVLQSRITGAIDFYNNLTTNSFYNEPVSILANAGSATRQRNSAKLRNRGLEIELSADIFRTRDFTWNVSLNGTTYGTTLVDIPDVLVPDNTGTDLEMFPGCWEANGEGWSATGAGNVGYAYYLRGEGKDWYNIWLYRYAGVDQSTGLPLYWHRVTTEDHENGLYTNTEVGGDVTTTSSGEASRYELGSAIPDWIGGITSTIRYKNFDFSFVIAYQLGGKFFSTEYANGLFRSGYQGVTRESPTEYLVGNTWTPENTDAEYPMQWWNTNYYDGSTFGSWKYTDMSLFSASYMRVKNLTIGYTLPSKISKKMLIERLRVYASADNLFYISAKKGVDPSMSVTGGYEVGQYIYPNIRSFSFGVSIGF